MSLRIIKIFTVLFAIALFGGCGQKGELYHPGEKQTALVSYLHIA